MTRKFKLGTLATALAMAALGASPAWSQATAGSTSTDSAASSQYDSSHTHLNPNCYDPVTERYRSSSDCVGLSGAGTAGAGTTGTTGTAGTTGSTGTTASTGTAAAGSLGSSSTPGSSSAGTTSGTGTTSGMSGTGSGTGAAGAGTGGTGSGM